MNYYFDMETIRFNPYINDAKIVTAQIKKGGDVVKVLKEWELGEDKLIEELAFIFADINIYKGTRTYNRVYTYNGWYDFHFLMGRINLLSDCSISDKRKLFNMFVLYTNHCDLLQYNTGNFVSLEKLRKRYGIKRECIYLGIDVHRLYKMKDYDNIILHGIDDVNILYELVTKYGFDYDFEKKKTLVDYF